MQTAVKYTPLHLISSETQRVQAWLGAFGVAPKSDLTAMLRVAASRARQLALAAPKLARGFAAEAEAAKSGGGVSEGGWGTERCGAGWIALNRPSAPQPSVWRISYSACRA